MRIRRATIKKVNYKKGTVKVLFDDTGKEKEALDDVCVCCGFAIPVSYLSDTDTLGRGIETRAVEVIIRDGSHFAFVDNRLADACLSKRAWQEPLCRDGF